MIKLSFDTLIILVIISAIVGGVGVWLQLTKVKD